MVVCRWGGNVTKRAVYLLSVIGRVGEHGGHVKHQLVVLVGRVKRVCACGVSCNREQDDLCHPHPMI